jgi:NAD(P)-dependent dehydrogenase (short-subunit alcohol dehydrogenase family)
LADRPISDKNFVTYYKAWLEVCEKEFRQFLRVPELGLTRSCQERSSKAVDKFNILQHKVGSLALKLDVRDAVEVQSVVARSRDEFGGIDILVNNAAITANFGRLDGQRLQFWERDLKVNLSGASIVPKQSGLACRKRNGV